MRDREEAWNKIEKLALKNPQVQLLYVIYIHVHVKATVHSTWYSVYPTHCTMNKYISLQFTQLSRPQAITTKLNIAQSEPMEDTTGEAPPSSAPPVSNDTSICRQQEFQGV